MKSWETFGAFGATVVELTWRDLFKLILGTELTVFGTSTYVCRRGCSRQKAGSSAWRREPQLKGQRER